MRVTKLALEIRYNLREALAAAPRDGRVAGPRRHLEPAARTCRQVVIRLLRVMSRRRALNSEGSRPGQALLGPRRPACGRSAAGCRRPCPRAFSRCRSWPSSMMMRSISSTRSRSSASSGIEDLLRRRLELGRRPAATAGGAAAAAPRRPAPRFSSRQAREKRNGKSALASSNSVFAASFLREVVLADQALDPRRPGVCSFSSMTLPRLRGQLLDLLLDEAGCARGCACPGSRGRGRG